MPGMLFESPFPMCRESTVLAIRSAPSCTGCFSITSTSSSSSTSGASRGNTDISGRSSGRSSTATSTAATPARASPGSRIDYLEFIARVTSHIPDKGQVMVRYYGLYANAQIRPSPGVDVRRREAAARPRLRDSRPGGGRGERGIRIAAGWEEAEAWLLREAFRPTHRLSRPPGFETSTS
jgi:hypothetical protein